MGQVGASTTQRIEGTAASEQLRDHGGTWPNPPAAVKTSRTPRVTCARARAASMGTKMGTGPGAPEADMAGDDETTAGADGGEAPARRAQTAGRAPA